MTIRGIVVTRQGTNPGPQHDVTGPNLLVRQPVGPMPFWQRDWPNQARQATRDTGFTSAALTFATTRPFAQLDWQRQQAIQARDTGFTQNLLETTLYPTGPKPFLNIELTQQARGAFQRHDGLWPNLVVIQPAPVAKPFALTDWPSMQAKQPYAQIDVPANLVINTTPTPSPSGHIGGDDAPDGWRKRHRRHEERRAFDIRAAFDALTASPDPETVQRALDIVRPENISKVSANYGAFDLLALTSPKVGELLALWREEQERAELLELLEIPGILH